MEKSDENRANFRRKHRFARGGSALNAIVSYKKPAVKRRVRL
jgi:hypothetical protein